MKTKLIEATNGLNHGKFLLGKFDDAEWAAKSKVDEEWAKETGGPSFNQSLLERCGWGRSGYFWVADLQTGEGAVFRFGGRAHEDLKKHRIWVCPMYEFLLEWLYAEYTKDPNRMEALDVPELIRLDTDHFEMYGHRRPGPENVP